jgi:integrase
MRSARSATTWPDGPISAHKNIERLRSFFSFCLEAGWIQKNPAKALRPPKVERHEERVRVFTADDLAKITAACDVYPARNSRGPERTEVVIRPFMLTLRYTGLRIGDVVGLREGILCRTDASSSERRRPERRCTCRFQMPSLPSHWTNVGSTSEYFFWTGNGLLKSAVADWQRSLRKLFYIGTRRRQSAHVPPHVRHHAADKRRADRGRRHSARPLHAGNHSEVLLALS